MAPVEARDPRARARRALGDRDAAAPAATAIMTTDTVCKEVTVGGGGLHGRGHGQGGGHAGPEHGHHAGRAHHRRPLRPRGPGRRAARRGGEQLQPAHAWTAAPRPTTPCWCWRAAPLGSVPGRRARRRARPGVRRAGRDDGGRRRGGHQGGPRRGDRRGVRRRGAPRRAQGGGLRCSSSARSTARTRTGGGW